MRRCSLLTRASLGREKYGGLIDGAEYSLMSAECGIDYGHVGLCSPDQKMDGRLIVDPSMVNGSDRILQRIQRSVTKMKLLPSVP